MYVFPVIYKVLCNKLLAAVENLSAAAYKNVSLCLSVNENNLCNDDEMTCQSFYLTQIYF
jgi:hypothetical protein